MAGGVPAAVEQDGNTVRLRAPVDSGRARIEIGFSGTMNSGSLGLYAGDGFVVTQMQPNYARNVFPCFDDPRLKATFDVSVNAGANDVVVTNGGTDALLPPCLLLIAAGEFQEITAGRVRLFSLDDPQRYAAALDAATDALGYLENYLGIAYPWGKLDLIVIPSFEVDGMESTGAIVFRGGAIADSERAATLVAHEVAHQWFGSLVTPRSWADLWLSEGFATWIAAKATGSEVNAVREIRTAMAADSARSARPLRGETLDPKEMFDTTTYAKGAAILRMVEASVGEEAFRSGVREYVRRHANGDASTDDLWFAEAAAPFLDAPGVPHLTFVWSGTSIRIVRRDAAKRMVPAFLRIALGDGTTVARHERIRDDVTEIAMPAAVAWVFGNANASGYYRCSYHDFGAIPLPELSAPERAAFLADVYDAAWSAESDTLVLLRVLEAMAGDQACAAMAGEIHEQLSDLLSNAPAASASDGMERLEQATGAERIAACELLLRKAGTRRAAWSYLKAHWNELQGDLISFGGRGAIPALAAASDPELRNDIAVFFAQHPPHGAERALQQTLEQIDARIRFREREQRKYLCRSIWVEAGRPAVTPQLRFAHSILNALTSALHGSLQTRLLFDQLALTSPEWMHSAGDLRNAHGGVEQLFFRLFRGEAIVNEPVVQLVSRARDDLNAAAAAAETALATIATEGAEPLRILAILGAREATARDSFLGGLIVFADLFDGEAQAAPWRAGLPAVERDIARTRMTLGRAAQGEIGGEFRAAVTAENFLLPGTLRSQAVDLTAIDAAMRGDRTFDHAAATWAAFGFSPDEAAAWRDAGYAHPAAARIAAERR